LTIEVVALVERGLGNSSYLVGLGEGRALVIDPQRDPTPYRMEMEKRGWVPAATAETHLHADFISGGRELQELGAILYAPAGSGLVFDHQPMEPDAEVDLGGLTMRALPTPGHTPEHLSYLISDGRQPVALFSGGSLLVGSVARTDLIAPELTEPLARRLFRSLRDVITPLPDHLAVYPTHGAGSFCTAGGSNERITTLGAERTTNPYLLAEDEEQFVRLLLGSLGSYPPYYQHLRERNRLGPVVFGDEPPRLQPLSPQTLSRLAAEGTVVVDTRPVAEWAQGHIPGALAISLRDVLAPWLGWLLDIDRPIAFVLGDGQNPAEVVRQAVGIGYEHLAGVLEGGFSAWKESGRSVATTPVMDFSEVDDRQLLDVRQASEWDDGHIPGAVNIELGRLLEADLPVGALAVHCGHGERAATAVSLLERTGCSDIVVVTGGPADWEQLTGQPLQPT
jgi:hydroxyacylglutathione hydrolase